MRNVERNKGDVDRLVERLKELTLVIAIGVRDDFVLVSIGPTTDTLAGLGKGKLLDSRPEFAPMHKFADKRIVSIGLSQQSILRPIGQQPPRSRRPA